MSATPSAATPGRAGSDPGYRAVRDAQESELRERRRVARAEQRAREQQSAAARASKPEPAPQPAESEEPDEAEETGDTEEEETGGSPRLPRLPPPSPGSARAKVHSAAQAADGLLIGLIAYAIAINYLRGGWSGVQDWGRAKFFNNPTQGQESGSSSGGSSGTSSGGSSSGGLGGLGTTLGKLPSILKQK